MSPASPDKQLIDHLCRHCALNHTEALRLIQEVVAFYNETPQDFIRRRHLELQKSGLSNATIYEQISYELGARRFSSEPMSMRQIRRAIYG
ncbi:MAG: hypothetical protein KTR32_11910 [Granulosicoccus sp.]|nr:hypothetical protein [Granulosicoccus sp.]